MTKIRLNQILLLTLVTAFLTLQWSSTHIHLAQHHNHDGDHHQHQIESHSHQSIDNFVDANVLADHNNDFNVVKLDHEVSSQKIEKLEKPFTTVIPPTSLGQLSQTEVDNSVFSELINTKLSYLYQSPSKSRAPPQYS